MGHTEMKLAVAGLNRQAVTNRIQKLASGKWSSFSSAERAAFLFAHKQAKKPFALSPQDYRVLARYFGPERAVDVIWWASCCNYMTRVASAFRLPLEKENVFDGFLPE